MTLDTDRINIMLVRINGGNTSPVGIRIPKIGMTTDAEITAAINDHGGRILCVRMVPAGTVTVFALNYRMGGRLETFRFFIMALGANLSAQVADSRQTPLRVFPLINITCPVKVKGKTLTLYAKIIGHIEVPGQENEGDKRKRHPQWPQYMILHRCLLSAEILISRTQMNGYPPEKALWYRFPKSRIRIFRLKSLTIPKVSVPNKLIFDSEQHTVVYIYTTWWEKNAMAYLTKCLEGNVQGKSRFFSEIFREEQKKREEIIRR